MSTQVYESDRMTTTRFFAGKERQDAGQTFGYQVTFETVREVMVHRFGPMEVAQFARFDFDPATVEAR